MYRVVQKKKSLPNYKEAVLYRIKTCCRCDSSSSVKEALLPKSGDVTIICVTQIVMSFIGL